MKLFTIYFAVFVLLFPTITVAQSAAEIQFKKTQISCRYFSERQATNAEVFGKKMEHILRTTNPRTDQRKELTTIYFNQGQKFIDSVKFELKDDTQSTDLDRVNIALIAIIVAQGVVYLPVDNPGKSAEWYQIQLFDDCVRR